MNKSCRKNARSERKSEWVILSLCRSDQSSDILALSFCLCVLLHKYTTTHLTWLPRHIIQTPPSFSFSFPFFWCVCVVSFLKWMVGWFVQPSNDYPSCVYCCVRIWKSKFKWILAREARTQTKNVLIHFWIAKRKRNSRAATKAARWRQPIPITTTIRKSHAHMKESNDNRAREKEREKK